MRRSVVGPGLWCLELGMIHYQLSMCRGCFFYCCVRSRFLLINLCLSPFGFGSRFKEVHVQHSADGPPKLASRRLPPFFSFALPCFFSLFFHGFFCRRSARACCS